MPARNFVVVDDDAAVARDLMHAACHLDHAHRAGGVSQDLVRLEGPDRKEHPSRELFTRCVLLSEELGDGLRGFRTRSFEPQRRRHHPNRPEYFGPPRSEEHTSALRSLMRTSSAVFCWKKK